MRRRAHLIAARARVEAPPGLALGDRHDSTQSGSPTERIALPPVSV
jgi:hypothetical protein